MNDGLPHCPHGVRCAVVGLDGWLTRIGPEACGLCPTDEPVGLPYRLGNGERLEVESVEPVYVPCERTPWCVLVGLEGEQHSAPCIVMPPRPVYDFDSMPSPPVEELPSCPTGTAK